MTNLDLIESFVTENPFGFTEEELDIVRGWRHLIYGRFFVLRELKNYTLFLSTTSPSMVYGVVALFEPFNQQVGTTSR